LKDNYKSQFPTRTEQQQNIIIWERCKFWLGMTTKH